MPAEEHATVLVVEDDEGVARLQRLRLERAGYQVAGAATADEGLRRLLAGGIDLVVLDHRLPGGASGLDVYRQAKESGRDVPAILVTAFSDESVVLQALRAGVNDFVPKTPDYLDHLVPAVARALKERQTERQLAESRAQLAGIIDSAMDAILTVGPAGQVAHFNPAAEQIFACRAADAVGSPVGRFLPGWADLFQGAGGGFVPGPPFRQETEGARGNGERFPVEVSLSKDERRQFWTCIARDLTARRRAEEEHDRLVREQAARAEAERATAALRESESRFRHLADAMPQIVWVFGPGDKLRYVNRRWFEYTGLTPEETRDRAKARAVVHPDDDPVVEARAAEARTTGQPYQVEFRLRRASGGAYRWFLGRGVPVLDPARGEVWWYGTSTDIDDQKRAEQALREADRRKDEFLATLAHELRNPLAPIRNALEIMRLADNAPATVEEGRAMMDRQVKQMVRLIDDLLDLSRISRGKVQLRKERVELAEVVESAVESSRPLIEAQRHELTVRLPSEPVVLNADPTRLAQVLLNLLNNAAKYTEPGGRIALAAEVGRDKETRRQGDRETGLSSRASSEIVIRVNDTGVGIPPEMLPGLFEMFTQIDTSPERSQGGLGIGLSIVRGLVELHGGRVEAHSEGVGRGSEFVVRLPLDESGRVPAAPPAAKWPADPAPPRRILVVDDNEDGAETLAKVLRVRGHDVSLANDGPSALEAARGYRPEVVLLDVGLPGMSGYEVARHLRREPGLADVLVIAVTGFGQEEDRRRAHEAGFDAHCVKPLDLEVLEALLQRGGSCRRSAD